MPRGIVQPPPPPLTEKNLYDLLEAIVARTPWASEVEKVVYTDLLRQLREVNIFGYLSTQITTGSDEED